METVIRGAVGPSAVHGSACSAKEGAFTFILLIVFFGILIV